MATAGQDSVIRLFDIRTFRELEVLKGHEKEVNCIEWHPIHHSLLVSGDALGTINYFSLLSPTPSTPITTLSAAHEDAVFSLSFHPLGHILCSGSKDFTARFWCRARPPGGQEFDKWHLTEEGAAQKELERITKREWGTNALPANAAGGGGGGGDKQQVALPGLSNLVAAVNSVKTGPTTTGGGHPVFQDWVRLMSMLAPRRRAYPPLRPWDLPVLVPKDKDKAVSSHEEGRRFLVRTICFGIITARVVGLQIGIGTGEETEGEWIEIEIHEGEDRIQEVIRCMAVGQGDLLPVLHQVKGDTITPLLLPTIPLTRRHPTLLRPTTNPAIRPHPITLCPLDPVLLLKVILIIDLLRDPLRIIIQVAKEITALPLPAGMASTAVVVVVEEEEGTVGMDGDRTKRHRERERMHHGYCTTNYLMCKTCTQLICQPRAQRATVKPN